MARTWQGVRGSGGLVGRVGRPTVGWKGCVDSPIGFNGLAPIECSIAWTVPSRGRQSLDQQGRVHHSTGNECEGRPSPTNKPGPPTGSPPRCGTACCRETGRPPAAPCPPARARGAGGGSVGRGWRAGGPASVVPHPFPFQLAFWASAISNTSSKASNESCLRTSSFSHAPWERGRVLRAWALGASAPTRAPRNAPPPLCPAPPPTLSPCQVVVGGDHDAKHIGAGRRCERRRLGGSCGQRATAGGAGGDRGRPCGREIEWERFGWSGRKRDGGGRQPGLWRVVMGDARPLPLPPARQTPPPLARSRRRPSSTPHAAAGGGTSGRAAADGWRGECFVGRCRTGRRTKLAVATRRPPARPTDNGVPGYARSQVPSATQPAPDAAAAGPA